MEGAAGIGKTALISYLLSSRRDYRRTVWFDFSGPPRLDDAQSEIDQRLRLLSDERQRDDGRIVVIDHIDMYDDEILDVLVRRVLNWKVVRALIIPTRLPRPNRRSPVMKLAPLTPYYGRELFKALTTVEVAPEIRDQIVLRSNGNPMLLKMQIAVLNAGGTNSVQEALNLPIFEFDEAIPADRVIEVAKPKLIFVSGELLAALQKQPETIFSLPPRRFEEILAELLEARGMKVELTQASKDGGRDILARMDTDIGKILCLVEAKRYAQDRKVGVELVRQLYGVFCDHVATKAMLVTTSTFTKGAKEFQQRHEYEMSLKDYADVQKWIKDFKKTGSGIILPP